MPHALVAVNDARARHSLPSDVQRMTVVADPLRCHLECVALVAVLDNQLVPLRALPEFAIDAVVGAAVQSRITFDGLVPKGTEGSSLAVIGFLQFAFSVAVQPVDQEAVRELVETYQSRSTPTIVIGENVMIGFDPEELDQILAK